MFDTETMEERGHGDLAERRCSTTPSVERVSTNARARSLADIVGGITPVTLSDERRLRVSPELQAILPDGLQQGNVVGVGGVGATSLGLALAAGPVRTGGWVALVGCPQVSLPAAEAAGMPLHRVVVVETPPRARWADVVAALADAFDVIVVAPATAVRTSEARALRARLRDRGRLLVDLADAWPERPDLRLRGVRQEWVGLGMGHGVLHARRLVVEVGGRRGADRVRTATLMLPGTADEPLLRYAGADIDELVAATTPGSLDGDLASEGVVEPVLRSAG